MEIAQFKTRVHAVEQALGIRLLESRRAINAALLRGGEGASWGDWLARQKERVLKTIPPYGTAAYEKAQGILAWTKKRGAEAAKYTWKKTKQGGKWVKRKGSAGLSRAQKAAKRKACKMSNKACASDSLRSPIRLNKMMKDLQEMQSGGIAVSGDAMRIWWKNLLQTIKILQNELMRLKGAAAQQQSR